MLGFPGSSAGKESTCNAGDLDFIPGSGRSPTEETDYPLQYSWASLLAQTVKNPPAKWETWVRSLGWEDSLEEGMATHSSVLAWRIPRTEEPGRLQSMGSQRVRHNWATQHSTVRICQSPIPNFIPLHPTQACGFSSSHVWIWELDYKESGVPKNWCFWTVVFKRDSWESLGLQGDPASPS